MFSCSPQSESNQELFSKVKEILKKEHGGENCPWTDLQMEGMVIGINFVSHGFIIDVFISSNTVIPRLQIRQSICGELSYYYFHHTRPYFF